MALEITNYDMNKQLVEHYESKMSKKTLEKIINKIVIPYFEESLQNHKYFMLLCHDARDYTVFNLQGKMTVRDINKDIIECLKNRGIVLAIDEQSDGNYEIWIRDKKTKDNVIYYLFNYEFGVIEYE